MANKKGDLGVFSFIRACIKEGISISLPVSDDSRFDAIVGVTFLYKIQIKEMYQDKRSNSYILQNYSTKTRGSQKYLKHVYTKQEVDFIIGYIKQTDEFYIIPIDEFKGKQVIAIRHNQKMGTSSRDRLKFLNAFNLLTQNPMPS